MTNRARGWSPHHRDSRLEHDLKRSIELKHILDDAAQSQTGSLGERVETDGRSAPEIASDIAQRIREYSVVQSAPLERSVTFASKYQDWILSERKVATTRRITASTIIPHQST